MSSTRNNAENEPPRPLGRRRGHTRNATVVLGDVREQAGYEAAKEMDRLRETEKQVVQAALIGQSLMAAKEELQRDADARERELLGAVAALEDQLRASREGERAAAARLARGLEEAARMAQEESDLGAERRRAAEAAARANRALEEAEGRARERIDALGDANKDLHRRLREAEAEAARLRAEASREAERLGRARAELDAAHATVRSLDADVAEGRGIIKGLEQTVASQRAAAARNDALRREVAALRAAAEVAAEQAREREQLERRLQQTEAEYERLQESIKALPSRGGHGPAARDSRQPPSPGAAAAAAGAASSSSSSSAAAAASSSGAPSSPASAYPSPGSKRRRSNDGSPPPQRPPSLIHELQALLEEKYAAREGEGACECGGAPTPQRVQDDILREYFHLCALSVKVCLQRAEGLSCNLPIARLYQRATAMDVAFEDYHAWIKATLIDLEQRSRWSKASIGSVFELTEPRKRPVG